MHRRLVDVARDAFGLFTPAERRAVAFVGAVMVVGAVLETVGIAAIVPFLQVLATPESAPTGALALFHDAIGRPSPTTFVLVLGAVVLAAVLVASAFAAFSAWLQLRFVHRLGHSLSARLLAAALARPHAWHVRRNSSEVANHVLYEAPAVVAGVVQPGLVLVSRTLVAVGILALLVIVQPAAALVVLALAGAAFGGVYMLLRRRLNALGTTSVSLNQARVRLATEAVHGAKELRILGRQAAHARAFEAASTRHAAVRATASAIAQTPRYLMQAVVFTTVMAVVLVLVASGADLPTVLPVVGVFAFAGFRVLPALQEILTAAGQFRYNEALVEVVVEGIRAAPSPAPVVAPLPFEDRVELVGVTYAHDVDRPPALRRVDLVVPKGASVAIVGPTGAGKSTLLDVFLGLIEPGAGVVRVDGVPLQGDVVARWHRSIGYVPQEIYLADATILENIAFGVPREEIDHAAAERAARLAQVHDLIESLPEGYATSTGDRGVRLSGGQRQRIGIARALYHDPPVIVLDEATSDIDGVTQAAITDALTGLAGRKTMLVVAHRLSTVRRCDSIHVLDAGSIVASGSYDELMRTSEKFRELAA